MDRADIAAYAMQGLMAQKSTAPGIDGSVFDYDAIAELAYSITDMLIDAYASSAEPDLYAVLAMQSMVAKVLNDGSDFDYSDIITAALNMSTAMNPV